MTGVGDDGERGGLAASGCGRTDVAGGEGGFATVGGGRSGEDLSVDSKEQPPRIRLNPAAARKFQSLEQ